MNDVHTIAPLPAGRKPWRAPRLQDLSGWEHTCGSITNTAGEMFMKGVPDPVETSQPLSALGSYMQMGDVS